MRRSAVKLAIVVGSAMGAAAMTVPIVSAAPSTPSPPRTITGTVGDVASRWTADGSRIVTDATIQTATGEVVVSQLGGTVLGLGMRTFPSPPMLASGMTVELTAHDDVDLAQRVHTVVDDVVVTGGATYDFVRTGPTTAGHYIYWESGCIFVTTDSAGTSALPDATTFPLVDQAIATWNTDTASGSYMVVKSLGSAAGEVGNDGVNLIKFRDDTWCRPAVDDDPARCYNASAAGITTATYVDDGSSSRDGAIVDADVELNNVNFAISNAGVTANTAQSCHAELLNTLTHELGHVHGLEHTCLAVGDPPRIDNNGNAVPECADTTDPAILDATMYNFQDCGETTKETLEADDIAGITTIYPLANDPNTCAPPAPITSGGCCSAAGSSPDPAVPFAPFALGAMTLGAIIRRRRA